MYKPQKTRIALLSNAEIDELYSLPIFNEKDRDIFLLYPIVTISY